MNKSKLIITVSEKSGVNVADCEKVLDAFEEVFSKEISNSKRVGNAFDKAYKIMTFLKGKKDSK